MISLELVVALLLQLLELHDGAPGDFLVLICELLVVLLDLLFLAS